MRRYFVLGLIVFLPLVVTIKFLFWIIDFFDSIFAINQGRFLYFIPDHFHPHNILGFPLPGLGVAFSVICILILGVLSRNFFGKKMLHFGDSMVDRIPLARTIYKVARDIMRTYASQQEHQFSKVVLVNFPHKDSLSLGFVTSDSLPAVQVGPVPLLSVFVPTTPNPTSGFLLFLPHDQVTELNMTIENAFKLIISGGMVNPEDTAKNDDF